MIRKEEEGMKMTKKILVFGGTGFFGQAFIQQALQEGYKVLSVSRRGQPSSQASWQEQVEWIAADVFQPDKWQQYLQGVDVLIDAVGIIREKPKKQVTYQRLNVEVARLLATEAKKKQVPLFVYLSARPFTHLFLKDYFASKQAAEAIVREKYPKALIIRPSLIVGQGRRGTRLMRKLSPMIRWFLPEFYPKNLEETAQEVLKQIQLAILTEEK